MEGHAATIVSSYHPHEISERAGIDKAANEKAAKLKADRLARVVDMRAGALIGLIGADKAKAQRIVASFRRAVGRV